LSSSVFLKFLPKTNRYSFQFQYDTVDCGPSCLRMIALHYGKDYSLEYLRELCYLNREGVSLTSMSEAAEKLGFRTLMAALDTDTLIDDCPLPAVLHWNQEHFVVLYDIEAPGRLFKKRGRTFVMADPGHGIVKVNEATFMSAWLSTAEQKGVVLALDPTPEFYEKQGHGKRHRGFGFLLKYLIPFKSYLLQIVLGMILASFFSLALPVLTQTLVDTGIGQKSEPVIYLILFSQLFLFVGGVFIDLIRSWLLLHVNIRISLHIISDFLSKLLRLPVSYFDSKSVGDISQRINDHRRIQEFLTGSLLSSLFSIINIVVFTVVLAYYNWMILLTFSVLSTAGVAWIFLFQKRRKALDYRRFARNRESQDKLFEMITGLPEIKLSGSETAKRWEWERVQVRTFKLNIKSLALEQYQRTGLNFFNYLKNIIISFIAAESVIHGHLTIGSMLSISFILGQTNSPLEQLVNFFKAAQDAQLSMDRMGEVHLKDNEDEDLAPASVARLQLHDDLALNGVSFQYEGPTSPYVLKNVNITIPKGKVTAIVGASGSGKTTLLKLLLKFHQPVSGEILLGNYALSKIPSKIWRSKTGTVMQNGYIFTDTIARNIALDGEDIDPVRMENAVRVTNSKEFIEELPLRYTTKIGGSGIGLSGGQRQRILMARAVYKNPDYLFFDEATSSLDAKNEREIMENLQAVFKGKTVVIIAHRLSTVIRADQIIVLEKGEVLEVGGHLSLCKKRGKYYELIRNQLELGD